MAFRCRWLATRGRERDDVLARLRFKIVDELVEEVYDPGLYALEVEEWLVVIGDGADDLASVKRAEAAKLSEDGGDAVYFAMDDGTMTYELVQFREGQPAWSIAYDGSDGVTDPKFTGAIPWHARTLLAKLEKEQAKAGGPKGAVDFIYDLGAHFARELVGFRHDESLGSGEHVPIWSLAAKPSR